MVDQCDPKEASCQKWEKVTEACFFNRDLSQNVDERTDGRTDGRLGIKKVVY